MANSRFRFLRFRYRFGIVRRLDRLLQHHYWHRNDGHDVGLQSIVLPLHQFLLQTTSHLVLNCVDSPRTEITLDVVA